MFPMLLASGVAMVSLVVALGKAGVVNRQAIGGSLGMGLAQLASIANIGVTTGSEIHLLDQAFVMCTLNTGTLILLAMLSLNSGFDKPAEQFDSRRLWWVIVILAIVCPFAFGVHLLVGGLVLAVTITLLHFACFTRRVGLATLSLCVAGGIPFLLLIGWMGQSLLFPVSPGTIQQCVESFDTAPYSSASWKQWEVSAAWLTDSGSEFDHSKPRQLLEQELDGKQNPLILKSAFRTGLIGPEDVNRLRDLNKKNDIVYEGDPARRYYEEQRAEGFFGKPILSLDMDDYVIRALITTNQLSESERDLLETRLLATFRDISNSELHLPIQDSLTVTQLLEVIGRSRHIDEFRPYVHGLLVDFQYLENKHFQAPGGFRSYPKTDASDDNATTAAVELMQYYGVPKELNLVALRSFLRSTMRDRSQLSRSNLRGTAHTATLLRLESLPDVPPISVWDYIRYESNLWMAVLLVLLCCYATLSAPNRNLQHGQTNAIL